MNKIFPFFLHVSFLMSQIEQRVKGEGEWALALELD